MLYQIRVHPRISSEHSRCCAYVHRFYTEKQPESMPYAEWCRVRLTEAKVLSYHAEDYYFEQELMDLFRPSVEHNQAWGAMLFLELFFYSGMPESYTKSVHNMVLAEEEAECNSAQANT